MKRILSVLLAAILLLGACNVSGWLLMPVRTNYGATWEAYLQEPKNTIDTLFFGSSLVYCDIVPTEMEDETGIHAYVMAGPEQTIPITYYYLKNACRTQSPKTVVVELNGMFFHQFQNYTKVNIGYMPWSWNRLAATLKAAENEELLGLLFPLYQYHDRIYTVTLSEVRQHFQPARDSNRGYTYLDKADQQGEVVDRAYTAVSPTYRQNLDYLHKIADFCEKREIQLVLYIAPAYARIPEAERAVLEADLQTVPHAVYYNCNDGSWPEADKESAWYDSLHYNVNGAVPFSRAFAQRLAEDLLS